MILSKPFHLGITPIENRGKEDVLQGDPQQPLITEIRFRKPKVSDLPALDPLAVRITKEGAEMTNMGTILQVLLRRFSNLPPDELDKIDFADMGGLLEEALGFFTGSLPTGKA